MHAALRQRVFWCEHIEQHTFNQRALLIQIGNDDREWAAGILFAIDAAPTARRPAVVFQRLEADTHGLLQTRRQCDLTAIGYTSQQRAIQRRHVVETDRDDMRWQLHALLLHGFRHAAIALRRGDSLTLVTNCPRNDRPIR